MENLLVVLSKEPWQEHLVQVNLSYSINSQELSWFIHLWRTGAMVNLCATAVLEQQLFFPHPIHVLFKQFVSLQTSQSVRAPGLINKLNICKIYCCKLRNKVKNVSLSISLQLLYCTLKKTRIINRAWIIQLNSCLISFPTFISNIFFPLFKPFGVN